MAKKFRDLTFKSDRLKTLDDEMQRLIDKLADTMDPDNAANGVRAFRRLVWDARGAADEALLRRYIALIQHLEGIDHLDSPDAEEAFTPEELVQLRRIRP